MKIVLKRSLSIILAITIVFSSAYIEFGELDFSGDFAFNLFKDLIVKPEAASEGDLTFCFNEESQSYSVTDCNESAIGEVVIPSIFNGKSVTVIEENAFMNCMNITAVTIPDTIVEIGYYAFYNCTGLREVHITDIAKWCQIAFNYEASNPLLYAGDLYLNDELVVDLVIPDGVASITEYAFYYCKSIVSVTIPESVAFIRKTAFYGCDNIINVCVPVSSASYQGLSFSLNGDSESYSVVGSDETVSKYLTIPSTYNGKPVTSIGYKAFMNNNNLISVVIPDTVTTLDMYAFSSCESLLSVTIPGSVKKIGTFAFSGSENIKKVNITDLAAWCNMDFSPWYDGGYRYSNPIEIGQNLYLNDKLVTDLVIPDGVTKISDTAFSRCNKIKSIYIPDSVESIGKEAFSGVTNAETITIGKGLKNVGDFAFIWCYGVKKVYISDLAAWCNIKYEYSGMTEWLACTPFADSNEADLYLNGELIRDLVIPDSITEISAFAFGGCKNIESVTIPDNVKTIGRGAFAHCYELKSVTFTNSLEKVGAKVFNNCTSLETVIIPESVTEIGEKSFGYNYSDKIDGFTIYGVAGSAAENYAVSNGFDFFAITQKPIQEIEGTQIDYENFIIRTTVQSADEIVDILELSDTATVEITPSYDNGVTELYGTGTIVTVFDGDEFIGDFTLVVEGDTNSDSVCNVLDVFEVERASNGHKELSDIYSIAADGNSDDIIDRNDYQSVVNKALSA